MALRLRKITGQLKAVERMLDEEHDCTCADVLMQLVSARRALKALSEKLILSHMENCIEGIGDAAAAKRKLHELLTVLRRYVE